MRRHFRFAHLVALLFLATTPLLAQDVMQVASDTHKVILENANVRVLDVRLKPGQKIVMHSHPASVVYFLTDANFKFTFPDGKTQEAEGKAGTAIWRGPVTHAVDNVGTTEAHFVQTELKGEDKTSTPSK
jgi:quercetin dioxygenase-like cupin family protein